MNKSGKISDQRLLAFSEGPITSNHQPHHRTHLLYSFIYSHPACPFAPFVSSPAPLHCFEFSSLIDRRVRPFVVLALFLFAAFFVLFIRKLSLAGGEQPSVSNFSPKRTAKAQTIFALFVLEQPSFFSHSTSTFMVHTEPVQYSPPLQSGLLLISRLFPTHVQSSHLFHSILYLHHLRFYHLTITSHSIELLGHLGLSPLHHVSQTLRYLHRR